MTTLPSDNRIEELARDLRARLGIPDDARLDAEDLLRRAKFLGLIGSYELVSDDELPRDAARWSPDGSLKVRQSALSGIEHEGAFLVAHELGHALMHTDVRNRRVDPHSYQHGRNIEPDERDADWFARTLIVPEYLTDQLPDVRPETLSAVFGLPAREANIRSDELERRRRKRLAIRRQIPTAYNPMITIGDSDVEEAYDSYINAWASARQ